MPYSIPVLVIFWNRPNLLSQLFDVLQQVQPTNLYLACDGPIENDILNRSLVEECRELVDHRLTWNVSSHYRYSDLNQGCRAGVADAITWFFENEEEGVILEDDVHPDISFFPYVEELLIRYRHDDRVGSISSHNFHRLERQSQDSYRFSIFSHCWGWGSWRRAWNQYDYALSSWPRFRDEGFLAGLGDIEFQRYWTKILDSVANGEIDTWDFAWTYSHWKSGMLSCIPDRCMVENHGFGPDATHTKVEICPLPALHPMTFPLRHPQFIAASPSHDRLTQKYQYSRPDLLERLKRKFRSWRYSANVR